MSLEETTYTSIQIMWKLLFRWKMRKQGNTSYRKTSHIRKAREKGKE